MIDRFKIYSSLILVVLFLSTGSSIVAQDYNFGIRAGLSYSRLLGPTINEPTHSDAFQFNNGIHFGVTFTYNITDVFGLRTEVSYNQIGTRYTFESPDAPYVFRDGLERAPRNGEITRFYDVSNAYVHVPLMANWKPIKKLELFGGIYTQFLVLPTSGGKVDFTAPINPETGEVYKYSFIQSIEGNYYSDDPREAKGNQGLVVDLIIDGEVTKVGMNRLVGAYYELDADEKRGSTYNWFDAGLEAGVSYYINRSLFLSFSAMYGLLDVTNDDLDVDFYRLNEFDKFNFRDDFDTNLSLQVSLGFKF